MGQRSPTETWFGIVAAFVERSTWSQAELAKRLETKPETIRKRLAELQAGGFVLEREEDHPHVYWSAPKNWFPGVLPFQADEARDLVRVLGRAPRSAMRDRLLHVVLQRLKRNMGGSATPPDVSATQPFWMNEDEERWLAIVEDAIARRTALKLRYFTSSTRTESWRHVSPHRLELGARPAFVATCHREGELKRFRVSNVLEARHDGVEAFREADPRAIERFAAESIAGFHDAGPTIECTFFVREADAAWVQRNLPDPAIRHQGAPGGARFSVVTPAVDMLARYVTSLGEAATPETPELREAVVRIARAALANATSER